MQLEENIQKESLNLLKELVKNRCVNYGTPESGNEIKSVNSLINYFKSKNIENFEIFEPQPGRGNLLVRFPGTDHSAPSLTLSGHIDVVPANPEDWSTDPFEPSEKDGWVYGRGTIDMLFITVSGAVALANLVTSGWKPKGNVNFLAVADEEAGGKFGAKWLIENVPDKIKTDYMISEFGGNSFPTKSGIKTMLMTAEKGPCFVNLKIKGTAGHASMPYKTENLSFVIGKILALIEENPPEIIITQAWKDTIEGLELTTIGDYSLLDATTAEKGIEILANSNIGLAKFLYSCLKMTVTPTMIKVGEKANVFPDRGEIDFDVRLLPGQTMNDLNNYFKKILPKDIFERITIEENTIGYDPGSDSPWNDNFVQVVESTYKELYPSKSLTPLFLPAVTDSRTFRKIGMKCYGFSVLDETIDLGKLLASIHASNEGIPIKSLHDTTEFFMKLAQKF